MAVSTPRALLDDIRNALDYLFESGLALYINAHSVRNERLTWLAAGLAGGGFDFGGPHATIELYRDWTSAGHYSAVLTDASLLQMTYDWRDGDIGGHRLVYVPCPVAPDLELLHEGEPIVDVVDLALESGLETRVLLRTPVRFDFDPQAAGPYHPASHVTVNSSACRIPCVAPLHPYRFLDFVFRHFYPDAWFAHSRFFAAGAGRTIGDPTIIPGDQASIQVHMNWRAR